MFNCLKNLFSKKQKCVIGTLVYEVELRFVEKEPEKQKRKYVRSGKYIGKFNGKNNKVKKGKK
jgi:hypothetical protein